MAKNKRSQDVDTKIVKMEFDNKNFESNVATTMSTLEKLKRLLSFKGVEKGFEKLDQAAGGFDSSMSGMEQAISKVTDQMSTLELIGRTALINLTNKAVDAGVQMAKSLSVDQLTAGWKKYEDKTKAVQAIMSADPSLGIAKVNQELERLNTYTDETSYNFVDMVGNIGKFMSVGIDLESSVNSMEGIANWAAAAGAGKEEASRAMYNISQSMGVGYMQRVDWKSIENANMATKEMKELLIEWGKAKGTLGASDTFGLGWNGDQEVTTKTFTDTLKDRWLTNDVLNAALAEYNWFYKQVEDLSNKYGTTTTETLNKIDEVHEKIRSGVGYDELTEQEKQWYVAYNGNIDHLSIKAFKAGQEAKTFTDAIDATADAVSTSWMKTFEWIFGDYERAKELWTEMSEIMYHVFAEGGALRNQVLMIWNTGWQPLNQEVVDAWSGGKRLMEGIYNFFKTFIDILDSVKKAFNDVFLFGESETQVWDLANALWYATEAFKHFTASLNLSQDALGGLYHIFKLFFKGVKIGVDFLIMLVKIFGEFVLFVKNVINDFLEWVNSLYKVSEAEKGLNKETEKSVTLFTYFGKAVEIARFAFNSLREGIKQIGSRFQEFIGRVKELDEFKKFVEYWKSQGNKFKEVMKNTFGESYTAVSKFLENVRKNWRLPTMDEMVESAGKAMKWIREHFESGKQAIIEFIERTDESFKNWGVYDVLKQYTSSIRTVWDGFINWLKSPDKNGISFDFKILDGKSFLEKAKTLGGQFIHQFVDGLGNTSMKDILSIGGTGGFIWFLVAVKKKIDSMTKEWNIGEVIKNLGQSLGALKGVLDAKKLDYMSIALLRFAQSIGILVVSIMVLAQLPEDKLATITTIIAILGATLALILKNNQKPTEYVKFSEAFGAFAEGVAGALKHFAKMAGIVGIVIAVAASLMGITAFILSMKNLDLKEYIPALELLGIIAAGLLTFTGAVMLIGKNSNGKGAAIIIGITVAITLLMRSVRNFPYKSLELFTQIFQTIGNLMVNLAGLILAAAAFEKFAKSSSGGTSTFFKSAIRFALAVGMISIGIGLIMNGFKEFTEYLPIFCRTITENGPGIAKAVETILTGILIAIVAQKSKIVLTVGALVLAVLAALDTVEPEVIEKVVKQIVKMIGTVAKYASTIIDALVKILIILMNELANAITKNAKPLIEAVKNLLGSITNVFAEGLKALFPILDDNAAKFIAKVGMYAGSAGLAIKALGGVAKAGKMIGDVFGSIGKFNSVTVFTHNVANAAKSVKHWYDGWKNIASGAEKLSTPFSNLTNILNVTAIAGKSISQWIGGLITAAPILIGSIAAIAAAMYIWNKHMERRNEIMFGLSTVQKEQIEQTNKLADSHKEWAATSETANLSLAKESNIVSALCTEYDKYLDENGRVKAGYESRADLILGKVAQATGLEKNELQELIEKHHSLTEAAKESLAVRFGNKYLDKHEDTYFAAISEVKEWKIQATVNDDSITNIKKKIADLKDYIRGQDEIALDKSTGIYDPAITESTEYRNATEAVKTYTAELAKLESQRAIINRNMLDAQGEIDRYERARKAISEGNIEELNKFRNEISSQYSLSAAEIQEKGSDVLLNMRNTANTVLKVLSSNADTTSDEMSLALENQKRTYENFGLSMISGTDNMRLAALRYREDFAKILGDTSDVVTAIDGIKEVMGADLKPEGTDVAKSFLTGVTDNLKDGRSTVEQAAASIADYFHIPQELLDAPDVKLYVTNIAEKLKSGDIDGAMRDLQSKLHIDNASALAGFDDNLGNQIVEKLVPNPETVAKYGVDIGTALGQSVATGISDMEYEMQGSLAFPTTDSPLVTAASTVTATIEEMYTKLQTSVQDSVSSIQSSTDIDLSANAEKTFGGYATGAATNLAKVPNVAKEAMSSAKSNLNVDTSGAGRHFASGYIGAIRAKIYDGSFYNAGYAAARSAHQGLMDGQQSHSPSKLTEKAGKFFIQGYINSMHNALGQVFEAGKSIGEIAVDGLSSAVELVNQVMDSTDDKYTITPVLDLSMIQNGSAAMYDMLSDTPGVELGDVTSRSIRSKSEQLQMTLDDSVSNALKGFNEVRDNTDNPTYVLQVDNYLDAQKVGRGTARYTKKELDNMSTQESRFGGNR